MFAVHSPISYHVVSFFSKMFLDVFRDRATKLTCVLDIALMLENSVHLNILMVISYGKALLLHDMGTERLNCFVLSSFRVLKSLISVSQALW